MQDPAAAVAKGTEKPQAAKLLGRAPRPINGPLISPGMWFKLLAQSVYQLSVCCFLLYGQATVFPELESNSVRHKTLIFNTFTWMQIGNAFNSRTVEPSLDQFSGLWENKIFLAIMAVIVGVQALMVEFAGDFAQTQSQSAEMWGIAILFGFGSLPVGFLLAIVWAQLVCAMPERTADQVAEPDPHAFDGAHLDDQAYSHKRPEPSIEAELTMRANSRRDLYALPEGAPTGVALKAASRSWSRKAIDMVKTLQAPNGASKL